MFRIHCKSFPEEWAALARLERILNCVRRGMDDCPQLDSVKMRALRYATPTKWEARSGKPIYDMTDNYRAAESLCRECPDYVPRGC